MIHHSIVRSVMLYRQDYKRSCCLVPSIEATSITRTIIYYLSDLQYYFAAGL